MPPASAASLTEVPAAPTGPPTAPIPVPAAAPSGAAPSGSGEGAAALADIPKPPPRPAAPRPAAPRPAPATQAVEKTENELDLNAVVLPVLARQYGPTLLAVILTAVITWIIARRRR